MPAMPWLADVARIERAWLDAYHAADAEPLSAQTLGSFPPDRLAELVFVAHPATRIVRSRFSGRDDLRRQPQRGAGRSGSTRRCRRTRLITRPDLDVVVRRLPPGGAVFLTQPDRRAIAWRGRGVGAGRLARFRYRINIAGMIEAGVFTAATLEKQDGH